MTFGILLKSCFRVQEQDPNMTKLNWNNLRETPIGHLVALLRALEYNSYVTEVNIGKYYITLRPAFYKKMFLANTRANDMIGQCISQTMKCNDTIQVLNIESNFISAKTMADLVHEACKSPVLRELRIDNQRNK